VGGSGIDNIDGGAGEDTASYDSSTTAVVINMLTNVNTLGDAQGDVLTNVENINGSAYSDTLSGNDVRNAIFGNAGNDVINGNGGDDWLVGGAGADIIDGGTGTDAVSYDASATAVNINLLTNTHSGGDATGDNLINIEDVNGSANNDTIMGSNVRNGVWGNAGVDTIYAYAGDDWISGGAGNDFINGGTGADYIDGGDGIDLTDYVSSASAVNVNLLTNVNTGGEAQGDSLINIENINASVFNDVINGDSAANAIWGNDGADIIYGNGGSDNIWGGAGNDTINGGGGIDYLFGDAGADVFVFSSLVDSTTSGRDIVSDFVHGTDKLKLTGLASSLAELSIIQNAGNTLVYDLDSTFSFQMTGTYNLDTSDFIFV
jgi:Ca2+-binding RTX toxin-like protein